MLRFALSSLRARWGSVTGSFVTMFAAATILCACGVLVQTGIEGHVEPSRYATAPVIVTADQHVRWTQVDVKHGKTKVRAKSKPVVDRVWFPESVERRLSSELPSARVVADTQFPVSVTPLRESHHPATVDGHNWTSTQLGHFWLVQGTAPQNQHDVALASDLAQTMHAETGSTIWMEAATNAAPERYRVVGIIDGSGPSRATSDVWYSDPQAGALAGRAGAATALGVFGSDMARVRAALAGTSVVVSTGSSRGDAEFIDAAVERTQLVSMGAAIGGTAVAVSMLVLAGTVGLTVRRRLRELAMLRAIGATPRQIQRLITTETTICGAAAAVLGAGFGLLVAGITQHRLNSIMAVAHPLDLAYGPIPLLAAVAGTAITGWGAARIAGRRVSRLAPAQALAETVTEHNGSSRIRSAATMLTASAAIGLSALLTTLHTEPAAVPTTYLVVVLWTASIALCGRWFTATAATALTKCSPLLPASGFLSAYFIRANPRRAAATIVPATLLIAMAATALLTPSTFDNAVAAQTRTGLTASTVVTARTPGGIPTSTIASLRAATRTPVTSMTRTTTWVGSHKHATTVISPGALTQTINPELAAGSIAQLRAGTVALSVNAVGGRHVGDNIGLILGDGSHVTLRLVAIFRDSLAFGDVLLCRNDVAAHLDDPRPTAALVAGRKPGTVRGLVDASMTAMSPTEFAARSGKNDKSSNAAAFAFTVLILVFTAVAIANTQALATSSRSGEISLIRSIGATARQVAGVLNVELAAITTLAVALGTGVAWLTLASFSEGVAGQPSPTITATYPLILAATFSLMALATAIPAARILRNRP